MGNQNLLLGLAGLVVIGYLIPKSAPADPTATNGQTLLDQLAAATNQLTSAASDAAYGAAAAALPQIPAPTQATLANGATGLLWQAQPTPMIGIGPFQTPNPAAALFPVTYDQAARTSFIQGLIGGPYLGGSSTTGGMTSYLGAL